MRQEIDVVWYIVNLIKKLILRKQQVFLEVEVIDFYVRDMIYFFRLFCVYWSG